MPAAWRSYLELTYFRLHVVVGVFVPLIAGAIIYASNGANPISYIDALFSPPSVSWHD